jgi:predicted nucleotidyltransferase component of viral defense system
MIRRIEITEAARAWGLMPHVVEKDYVLGWLLMGLGNHVVLQTQWIFKGGTCLKKCYLETYRFSEDLDFTLTPDASMDVNEIADMVRDVCIWVSQESGIELPPDEIEFKSAPNRRGTVILRGKLAYRGPLQQPTNPKIRFDLTTDEIIIRPPIFQPVNHPYSDCPSQQISVRCYPIDEILAEKTRALGERCMPRDLYDIIRMFRYPNLNFDAEAIRELTTRKCAHRNIALPSLDSINASPRSVELASEWTNMLGHQLP